MSTPEVETALRSVYEQISSHFSRTRYKMWIGVRDFLEGLPKGSTVADVGCGNGKNMSLPGLNMIGFDVCSGLLEKCRGKGLTVHYGDITSIPAEDASFDAVICIAVVHHLSTLERRKKAISELMRITKPGGRVYVTLWVGEGDCTRTWCDSGTVYTRYYHMFTHEEASELCSPYTFSIREECGNWHITLSK